MNIFSTKSGWISTCGWVVVIARVMEEDTNESLFKQEDLDDALFTDSESNTYNVEMAAPKG